jgi:DNA mismatch repair protein MutS2
MNAHAVERLEFPRVLAAVARYAETEAGAAAVRALEPDADPARLEEAQSLYRAAAQAETLGRVSLAGAVDLGPWLERAGKGGLLAPVELYRLGFTIRRGEELLAALETDSDPLLLAHYGRFTPPRGLAQAIEQSVDDSGEVKDTASPTLADIRREIARVEAEIDQVFERLLRSPAFQQYLQEPLITLRNGRRVVPVKHHFRSSVPGLVHDQSGSGQTVFVEPMAVVERQNRIQSLRGAEREEIDRILRRLTAVVAEMREPLSRLNNSVVRVDALLAKVRWGAAMGAVLPGLGGDVLELDAARHPLLEHPVPISLTVGGKKPVLVVTGPNTGGKTVALKCTGLMVLLALAGCPVPAGPGTRVPYYRDLLADIGDEQSLEQNLSTFSGHLRQLLPMIATAGPGVLLLVDEIGAGTDPDEGAALALALLEHWLGAGATVVVTTHFSRVKTLAYRDARVENAQVEFDRDELKPTYRLVMGQPGSSQALYIARRLGVPTALVERAREFLGDAATSVDDVIQRLNAVEREVAEGREAIARERLRLAAEAERLQQAEQAFLRRRTLERQEERQRWQQSLQELRRRADEAIRAVREADRAEREEAIRTLREVMREWAPPEPPEDTAGPGGESEDVSAGDWVTGPRLPEPAEVLQLEGETAMVQLGAMRLHLPRRELVKVARPADKRPRSPVRGPARSVPLELNLRGLTVAEALDALDRYLDEALLAGLPWARIVHGKGTGALRRAVQDLLREHPAVRAFRLGEPGEGGDGVTVVQLDDG